MEGRNGRGKKMEAAIGLEPMMEDLQSSALAAWLCRLGELVPQDGIEPPTRGFSVPCSTD